jgi:hypothetical protein
MPYSKICKELAVSSKTVHKYATEKKTLISRRIKEKLGRPPKIGRSWERKVGSYCNTHLVRTARDLKATLAFPYSVSSMTRILRKTTRGVHTLRVRPFLSKENVQKRADFADAHVAFDEKWKRVLFTDEKKFKLDGPDSTHQYWKGKESEVDESIDQSRNPRAGVMVWGGIAFGMKTSLFELQSTIDSEGYCELLKNEIFPELRRKGKGDLIFQQDNAPCHAARATKKFLSDEKIETLTWPAKSPDLNPIENMWGEMTRLLFIDRTKFDTVPELRAAIYRVWDEIPLSYVNGLIEGMSKRMLECHDAKGKWTKY